MAPFNTRRYTVSLSTPQQPIPNPRMAAPRTSQILLPHLIPARSQSSLRSCSSIGTLLDGLGTETRDSNWMDLGNKKEELSAVNKTTVQAVEQIGVFYLCSPNKSCRHMALQLFTTVKDLVTALGCTVRLVDDVLRDKTRDIVRTYYKYLTTQKAGSSQENDEESDIALASLAMDAKVVATWPQCLAAIIKAIHQSSCANRLIFTWQVACYRLLSVHPLVATVYGLNDIPLGDQIKVYTPNSNSSIVGLWVKAGLGKEDTVTDDEFRSWVNYLTFCCVAAPHNDESESAMRQTSFTLKTDRLTMLSARQLFRCFLPFIWADKQNLRSAVINALGLVNGQAVAVLWDEIMPYQNLYKKKDEDRKKEGKRRNLRTRITKILEYSADCFQNQTLLVNDQLKTFFLNYVVELTDYLENPPRKEASILDPAKKMKSEAESETLKIHFANLLVTVMHHAAAAGLTDKYFDYRT
eukprot:Ihof_evm1s493 gene=Ihof_evmTU1s493